MKRFLLIIIVLISAIGLIYFGFVLTKQNEHTFAPSAIFNSDDEQVFAVNRYKEAFLSPAYKPFEQNRLTAVLVDLPKSVSTVFISLKRPILVIEGNYNWSKSTVEDISQLFKEAQTEVLFAGRFIVVHVGQKLESAASVTSVFNEGDKKASANLWVFQPSFKWKRTDIYALPKGYFEYKSVATNNNYGKAVDDVGLFANVLPQNIEKYHFKEKFYALTYDSVLAKSPMSEWLEKGFVVASYKNQSFLVTDYQTQQLPSAYLIERSVHEDSVRFYGSIKSFSGFQLTSDFPIQSKGRIYTLEIEDKTIFTENKELAEAILLAYSLGQTLTLNEEKKLQFFEGLPTKTNYRFIDREIKNSLTWRDKLIFEVSAAPPGEQLILKTVDNWSLNPGFERITGLTPIIDHIRGGYSVFVYDQRGNYMLINQFGDEVWRGKADTSLLHAPQVVDLFENDKHQLLFTTEQALYLLDLNGNTVGNFPYNSDHLISTQVSTLKWKNTMRFLIGTTKGELIMVNQSGQELNVIQASKEGLQSIPFALNIGGNLRAWVVDKQNNQFLTYLETPAKADGLGKTNGTHFVKSGGTIRGYYLSGEKIMAADMNQAKSSLFSEGKILQVTPDFVFTQLKNEVRIFNHEGNLVRVQVVPFNEIGQVDFIQHPEQIYIGVFDYLENNYHIYSDNGEPIKKSPKESKEPIQVKYDTANRVLNIFTVINQMVICYKEKI